MAVFRDKIVPIPKVKGITINRADGNRVLFVKEAPYDAKAGYARPKRTTIGYVADEDVKSMNPTSGYKLIFPQEWEKLFGEKIPAIFKYIGMYAMMEAVNGVTGIKDAMDECFGISNADAMMDFVMYSMMYETYDTEHFETRMRDQQLYSESCQSASFYSDLFKNKIAYDQILEFKKKWVLQCKADGVEEVWLCIDGSDDDSGESAGVVFAEKERSMSLRNRKSVSFTYAVTENGKPVTFEVYRGGLVDARALSRTLIVLKEAGIRLKGVILERGCCDITALRYLNSEHIPYVIMVKDTPSEYADMVNEYGRKIKQNAEYLIRGTQVFGVQDKVQLFDSYQHEDYLTLFYDSRNESETISVLLQNLYAEIERCEKLLARGEMPVFVSQFKEILKVSDDKTGIDIDAEKLQELFDEKGLYSIVTSEDMKPEEVHHLSQCRECSETDHMMVKTHLGYGRERVRATISVQAKFTLGFISSCVRYELQEAAKQINRTTPEVIREMSRLYMIKTGESYVPVQSISESQEIIIKCLDSSVSILTEIAKEENDRIAGRGPTPRHRKTGPDRKKAVVTEPIQPVVQQIERAERQNKSKSKPGVKKGTKRAPVNKDGTVRKKPGVPKGTKRSPLKKDGSPRKKPGPKTDKSQTVA